VEATVELVEHEIVGVGLEQVGRPLTGEVDELARRLVDGRAAQLERA
jgi:hypothetical protein